MPQKVLNFFPAKDTFHCVGRELQRRRWQDDNAVMDSYLPEDHDEDQNPEKNSPDLEAELAENGAKALQNFNKVLDEFAEKQTELKEEAAEVDDNDQEGSHSEEEAGEVDDNVQDGSGESSGSEDDGK